MTIEPHTSPRKSLPLFEDRAAELSDAAIEAHLEAYAEAERERLGIHEGRKQWIDEMVDPSFKKEERPHVTLLISGLTKAQDFLVEGALRGVGYNVENIGCPDTDALQVGKEYGNRAQCNPTYFTVGNLVKHLITLRDEKGLSTQEII
ncbi:MAG: 2-hydroxyglutaryl-CoA dehydratase, partial [Myxococcota bacterium]